MTELETAVARLAAAAKAAAEAAASAGNSELAGRLLLLWAEFRGVATGLTESKRSPSVPRDMTDAHRRAISEASAPKGPAMAAARKAGWLTMADIARGLGVSKSYVSQVFSGDKPMSEKLRTAFELKTGYPASRWKS